MVKKLLLWRRLVKWLRGILLAITGSKKINWGAKVKEGLDIAKDALEQKKEKPKRRFFGRLREKQ